MRHDVCGRCGGRGRIYVPDFTGEDVDIEVCPSCDGRQEALPLGIDVPPAAHPVTPARELARTGGPVTSREAAESVDATRLEGMVLAAIRESGWGGMTADELLARFPDHSYSSITARPAALKRKGLVVDSGDKRKGRSGRSQAVLVTPEWARGVA